MGQGGEARQHQAGMTLRSLGDAAGDKRLTTL